MKDGELERHVRKIRILALPLALSAVLLVGGQG